MYDILNIYVYINTHILHNIETVVGQRNIKFGTTVNDACQGNLSACHSGHACHRFVSLQRTLEKVRYKNVLELTGLDGLWVGGWVGEV